MASLQATDDILVKDYIAGNEDALAILINRHKSKIYRFIHSKVLNKDISDDIFQETFVKVIKTIKLGSYQEEGKFLSWVMRISHNLVMDHFRNSKKMLFSRDYEDFPVFSFLTDNIQSIEAKLISEQIGSDLKKIINQLSDEQKEVIEMRLYKDMSFKEISEITGVSINTALGRMRYAILNLRKLVEKYQIILTD